MQQQIAFACITIVLAASIIYIISRLRKIDENVQHLYKAQQLAVSREEFEEYQLQHPSPQGATLLMCPLEGGGGAAAAAAAAGGGGAMASPMMVVSSPSSSLEVHADSRITEVEEEEEEEQAAAEAYDDVEVISPLVEEACFAEMEPSGGTVAVEEDSHAGEFVEVGADAAAMASESYNEILLQRDDASV